MGTTDEAMKYLDRGYYLGFTGYLCKVRKIRKQNNFIIVLGIEKKILFPG